MQLDGQLEPSGWPCRDQTGRGQDDPVTHAQPASPLYFWNNATDGGGVLDLVVADENEEYIQPNRDYCNHDPSSPCGDVGGWTYLPYRYPHPLAAAP